MLRLLARLLPDRRGVVAIEFAMAMPVMVILLLGTTEIGNLLLTQARIVSAAQTLTDLVAQQQSVTTTQVSSFFSASTLTLQPVSTTSLQMAVASVKFDSVTGAATQDWQQTSGTTISNAAALATGLGAPGDSVIVARAVYTYTPIFTSVISAAFTLTETAYSRPRLVSSIPHG